MKKTDLPFDNAGGLQKIIAIPESSFLSVGFNTDTSRVLNLTNTDNIICIPCLISDGSFQENKKESDNGDVYQVEITGFIYGKSKNNDKIISELDSGTWIVVTEDTEGNWTLFGSKRLVFERKKETSTARSGLKGTSFSFSCEDEYESINIQSPII